MCGTCQDTYHEWVSVFLNPLNSEIIVFMQLKHYLTIAVVIIGFGLVMHLEKIDFFTNLWGLELRRLAGVG